MDGCGTFILVSGIQREGLGSRLLLYIYRDATTYSN